MDSRDRKGEQKPPLKGEGATDGRVKVQRSKRKNEEETLCHISDCIQELPEAEEGEGIQFKEAKTGLTLA